GFPAMILLYINPRMLDSTGVAPVEEFAVSPLFGPVIQRTLAEFKRERPSVNVVLLDRNGTVIGERP
ncbi:MAG: cobalt-precorrin-5B (C(1))-methyltransferase, partial [Methanomicrobiales archaeon]